MQSHSFAVDAVGLIVLICRQLKFVLNFAHLFLSPFRVVLLRMCGCVCVAAFVQDAARAAGVVPAVIQALETQKENRDVAFQGCRAVVYLAANNPTNQVRVPKMDV
jgi:hypothetical protein